MILWQKESDAVDALFVDPFSETHQIDKIAIKKWTQNLQTANWINHFMLEDLQPHKSNATTEYLRSNRNMFFNDNQINLAMDLYSMSLCFAEPETVEVDLAYANRSACFLKMKFFDECLRDIELATEANYPHMAKLMERKAKYERLMERIPKARKFEPKIRFPLNTKFPCMTYPLKIKRDSKFGRHVVATGYIPVGEAILIEKPFVSIGLDRDQVQCSTCTEKEVKSL